MINDNPANLAIGKHKWVGELDYDFYNFADPLVWPGVWCGSGRNDIFAEDMSGTSLATNIGLELIKIYNTPASIIAINTLKNAGKITSTLNAQGFYEITPTSVAYIDEIRDKDTGLGSYMTRENLPRTQLIGPRDWECTEPNFLPASGINGYRACSSTGPGYGVLNAETTRVQASSIFSLMNTLNVQQDTTSGSNFNVATGL